MALQTRKTTFMFQQNADSIRNEPVHFDRYEQFAENMQQSQLVECIMSEFRNFQKDRETDLHQMESEFQNLDAMHARMASEVNKLVDQSAEIRGRQEAAERKKADLESQRDQIKNNTMDQKNQINDFKNILIAQGEQKAKAAKDCDKASIAEIKKTMAIGNSPAIGNGKAILDRICQLATGKETASYAVEGGDLFQSELTFSSTIKKADSSLIEKDTLKRMAGEINQDGTILSALMNPGNAAENVQFIPYFKVLFKLVQMGLTKKNKVNLERKQVTADKTLADLQVQIETQDAIIENLSFHETVSAEASRSRECDLINIKTKSDQLGNKIRDYQRFQNADFMQEYFQGI